MVPLVIAPDPVLGNKLGSLSINSARPTYQVAEDG